LRKSFTFVWDPLNGVGLLIASSFVPLATISSSESVNGLGVGSLGVSGPNWIGSDSGVGSLGSSGSFRSSG